MNLAAEQIAAAMEAEIIVRGDESGPRRAVIDSAEAGEGDLFFGLRGERVDGGEFAPAALEAGAWGVVAAGPTVRSLFVGSGATKGERKSPDGWVFAVDDPLRALQALATTWRRELGAPVVGVTGSVGKTSSRTLPGR